MCGRTSLFAPVEVIEARFDVSVDGSLPPRYNVPPRSWLATVTDASPERLSRLEWGLVPPWSDAPEAGPRPINARREGLTESAPFREAYRSRRCLVVVDGYYEWQETSQGKRPFRFERRDREPFAMAGLWERWSDDGTSLETVAVVTAEATDAVSDVHDRMPVILDREAEGRWLANAPDDPASDALLDPAYDEAFHHYPISARVNDPSNDDPSIIDPEEDDGQRTLGAF